MFAMKVFDEKFCKTMFFFFGNNRGILVSYGNEAFASLPPTRLILIVICSTESHQEKGIIFENMVLNLFPC